MYRRGLFGLWIALLMCLPLSAQTEPSAAIRSPEGRSTTLSQPDFDALSLYFKGVQSFNEGDDKRGRKAFSKSKKRIDKRLKAGILSEGDLRVLYSIEASLQLGGTPESLLKLGRLRCWTGGMDDEMVQQCANVAYRIGRLHDATYFLKQGQSQLGLTLERADGLRLIYLQMGELDSALAAVSALMQESEIAIEATLLYAQTLLDVGSEQEAYMVFKQAMRNYPEHFMVRLAHAKMLFTTGRERESQEAFTALFTDPDIQMAAKAQILMESLQQLAEVPRQSAEWTRLWEMALMAYEVNPTSAEMARLVGEIADARGEAMSAQRYVRESLTLPNGMQYESWELLCMLDQRTGDLPAYLQDALAASEAFPENERIALLLGTALYLNNQPQAAVKLLQLGLAKSQNVHMGNSPLAPEFYFRLGTAHFYVGDLENMAAAMDKLLLVFPDHPQAKNNYAYYLGCFGIRLEEAKKMAEQAVIAEPTNPNYLDTKAFIFMQEGKWEKAHTVMADCLMHGGDQLLESCLRAAHIAHHLKLSAEKEEHLTQAAQLGATEEMLQAADRQFIWQATQPIQR
jgi:tetratricopeptide (TPR) repeat protein